MTKKEFIVLLEKYLEGRATPQEVNFLEAYYEMFSTDVTPILKDRDQLKEEIKSRIDDNILRKETKPQIISLWVRIAATAAVVLLTISLFFFLNQNNKKAPSQIISKTIPGSNKAILTLANGRQISLTNVKNGLIEQQEDVKIYKSKNGQLIYSLIPSDNRVKNNEHSSSVGWNTITIPRGGQWQVVLPDGTRVWINSESSLRYPERFSGGIRKVVLKGEAYFEVFHNKKAPFHVSTNDQNVEVLGTHFNINSYSNEPFSKTTLLEGAVKITQLSSKQTIYLKPDQEAAVFSDHIQTINVDAEDAIAWKDGIFLFHDDTLDDVMKKISRWYNIDVEFKDESLKREMFSGTVSRFAQISEVLHKLELLGGVSFQIKNNEIVVVKK